jgi:predicted nucleotidyltransferase
MNNQPPVQMSLQEWEIVRAILATHIPDLEVWAFGSRARNQAKPFSDLDLAIISEKSLSSSLRAELVEAFSESDLPWKVDVVDWSTTNKVFREIIKQQKVILQKR